jgi:glycosyltransferase involved in cell wall biosynthesis
MKNSKTKTRTAFLHYTAPPVVGGVEAVMSAHAQAFIQAGYPVSIIAGRGETKALPEGTELILIPEVDSQHGEHSEINAILDSGTVPDGFDKFVHTIYSRLSDVVAQFDNLIIQNLFTKHFNLPLTAAVHRLIDDGIIKNPIAWCHDFSWTSPNSRSSVHPGYPWDLLRTYRSDTTYVTVSRQRQKTLADLLEIDADEIHVIYNGVNPDTLLGLTLEGQALIDRLQLLSADPVILMPVRVTKAKNIELAIQVVYELKKRQNRVKMVLTGPPDPHDEQSISYFESLLELRRELGVTDEMRFVFESGPDENANEPYIIDYDVVSDLIRISDLIFMPSHREGFGMPVLEAGLAGIPVISTEIPATQEIAAQEVVTIQPDDSPDKVADQIIALLEHNPVSVLRRRVRREYTWQAIFHDDIKPLLHRRGDSG